LSSAKKIGSHFVTPDFGLNVRELEHSEKILEHFALQTLDYVLESVYKVFDWF
jgi:hypothetical protein